VHIGDSPDEAAYRQTAAAWLGAHAILKESTTPADGNAHPDLARHIERCREWQRTLYDGGWAGITWPKAFGGQGGSPIESAIFAEEQARYDVSVGAFAVAIGMVGPTLIAHGTDEQKARFLPPMLRGDEIWCQLFSEPGSGSDLASLSTRAERDGDEWVITGQKVWTSSAHTADFGICLARTDPDVAKHAGISYFLVDMHAPGVTVRPLMQIDGAIHFNEVFLDGVRVPADRLVGDLHDGWRVANTTLSAERTAIGAGGRVGTREIAGLARQLGRSDDPVLRQEIARVHSREMAQRWTVYRVRTATANGRTPGPEAMILKLLNSHQVEHVGSVLMSILGSDGMLWHDDAPDAGFWQDMFLMQWSSRIGGGTEDINRNILGERVLGLPREPDVLKGLPWKDLPKS
jgi:alkylation response protein AidB-like acyl-CoA dehydrogenase